MLSSLQNNQTMMTASMSRSMSSSPDRRNDNDNENDENNHILANTTATNMINNNNINSSTAVAKHNTDNSKEPIKLNIPSKRKDGKTNETLYVSKEVRIEAIEKLRFNLIRYARGNDRRMAIRTIKEHKFLKKFIPLEVPGGEQFATIPSSELEQDLSQETVILNDIVLTPRHLAVKKDRIANAGTNNGGVYMIKGLTKVLCEQNKVAKNVGSRMDEKTLYRRVLTRLAKTTAADGVYTEINKMMGSKEMIVQQLQPGKHTVKGVVYTSDENIITVNMYNSLENGGQIHLEVDLSYDFGLFRKSDIISKRPWIVLKCHVHERTNLTTDNSFRSFTIQAPNLY